MLNRRRFLASSAALGGALFARTGRAANSAPPLPIPRVIDGAAGPISLSVASGQHAYRPGQLVQSLGYSSPVLGPTIRLERGVRTSFAIDNRMDRTTTVHWHGLAIPAELDGGPHNAIAAGKTWNPMLTVDQPETTAWYHPHPHGDTGRQVYGGLAGLLIVEDGSGARSGLPHDYGRDDLPLILQDRDLDRAGTPIYDLTPMDVMQGYRGDTFIVNGVESPVARVPAGLVRLRMLNGANARFFDLFFSDKREFHVIASDGGYLPAPVAVRSLLMAPGERFEVLVDFSDGRVVEMATGPDRNATMMGGMMGDAQALADGGRLMRFEVDPQLPAAVRTLPRTLAAVPRLDPANAVAHRQFDLGDMMMGMMAHGRGGGMMGGGMMRGGMMGRGPLMTINGRRFDMERIDVETRRGTLERWEIGSHRMAHPFHVHGTQFQILSLNGDKPPSHLQGWKDTVVVARHAEILVPVSQPATPDKPFMFHCHILEHEDAGMMGQYVCA